MEQPTKPTKAGRAPPPELRLDDANLPPNLREEITNVPVTPGIRPGTYDESPESASAERQHIFGTTADYFTSHDSLAPQPPEPIDPNVPRVQQHLDGAQSAHSILRRMTSYGKPVHRRDSISTIRAVNPDLPVSGNIISATLNMPHSVKWHKNADWELQPRRGQSALYDSLAYLSSEETPWNHTVVAWTGEIEPCADVPTPPGTPPKTTIGMASLNVLSAPVPLDGNPLPTPPLVEGHFLPKEDMSRLEHQLHHSKIKTVPVWLADDNPEGSAQTDGIMLKDQTRWRRFADFILYPLFHYKVQEPSDGRKERIQWADFTRMNQKFATRILELYKPGDIVMIHDYQLMLLPTMLRKQVPHMYISFFLHTPFPSSEFTRCLSRRKEIISGVMGSNLLGFQSFSYARHFSSSCQRILGFNSDSTGIEAFGSRVQCGAFPIGIDATKVQRLAWSDKVTTKVKALRRLYKGKKIIVGRDRLDSVRGVAQKLMAFERFLDLYPEWRDKVVLIQVTSPTNVMEEQEDPENRIASRVNELVMKINGMYGSLGFSPVQHYPQYLTQDEYWALLRAGDIGLITSVRDGMNTTSLEYVVCQREGAGPLILSEFSGTAGSLKDAIHINPWDLTGVANAINRALSMPEEQRQQMEQGLLEHVQTRNLQYWITGFLRRLVDVLATRKSAITTPLLDRSAMLEKYRKAKRRLFMFDYDGTLTPIVNEPSAAVPSEKIITSLQTLAADHRNAVWIISGRDQDFLEKHLGHIKELGFSAEHGSFIRHPGTTEWENLTEKFDMGWQKEVVAEFDRVTDRVPGSFTEKKRCAVTWHYRNADPEQGKLMAEELQKGLENTVGRKWDVEVMPGKANIEVRPTFINKGEIVKRLVETYSSDMQTVRDDSSDSDPDAESTTPSSGVDFALCMGDDFTDEDMFRALNGLMSDDSGHSNAKLNDKNCFTVTVGASTKVTLAGWHLLEAEDVIECVALLAGVGSGGSGATAGGTLSMGGMNLAAISSVEGRIPEDVEKAMQEFD